jgi:hypothetical protein
MRISSASLLSVVLGVILSLSPIYSGVGIAKADSVIATIPLTSDPKGNDTSFLDHNNITSNSFNETSLPPLTIPQQDVSLYRDSIGTTHIVGVLINPFTFPIQAVQVTASAHNANHQLISTGSTYADQPDQLRPGEKSGFDISLTNGLENAFNYELAVSYEKAGTLKPPALYLYMGQSSIDSGGTYHLLGEVTNMGNTPTSFVDVYAIFFDGNDKVVDVEHTYTTPSDLQPGQKAPFDLTISSPNSSLIRFVSFDAQSEDYSLLSSLPLMGLAGK